MSILFVLLMFSLCLRVVLVLVLKFFHPVFQTNMLDMLKQTGSTMVQQGHSIPSGLEFFSVNNTILAEDQEKLQRMPTAEEIYNTLNQIGDLSAPGPDGYPTIFFKKCRHIDGDESAKHQKINTLQDILFVYSSWPGQKTNFQKSSIYFSEGVSADNKKRYVELLGLPLGVYLFKSDKAATSYKFLEDKMKAKMAGWKDSS